MTRLPEGWSEATLDELRTPGARSMVDGPFGSNLKTAHYTESGPQVVRLQNIGEGVYRDAPAHISEEHFDRLRAHEVLPGDLLVASLGEVLPRACLMPGHIGPAIVKADCIRVRLSRGVDPKWVMYSLHTPETRQWAEARTHGVGRPRLGLRLIRQIPVWVPPLNEQRRIVEILEDHLSRLDAGSRLIGTAASRIVRMRQAARQQAINSAGNPMVTLAELIDRIETGKSLGGSAAPAVEGEWGIIKVSAMTWGEFRPDENKRIPEMLANPAYEIHPGDLLVSRANTSAYVGASVLVGDVRSRLLLSDKSLRLVPRAGVDAAWLNEVLQAPRSREQISALATGTKDSMRNISQKALLSIQVPHTPPEEQDRVLLRTRQRDDSIAVLDAAVARTRARATRLRQALLTVAFSGKLTGSSSDTERIEELVEAGV